jgi:hypothetical protein
MIPFLLKYSDYMSESLEYPVRHLPKSIGETFSRGLPPSSNKGAHLKVIKSKKKILRSY